MNLKTGMAVFAIISLVFLFGLVVAKQSTLPNATTAKQQTPSESGSRSPGNPWTAKTKIGQIVADRPHAARIFELVKIDYCCGGQTSLSDAAQEKQIDVDRLLSALLSVGTLDREQEQQNWQQADIGELMDHIVARHHTWLRRELPPLVETTKTVHRVHGDKHAELKQIVEIVEKLPDAILPHLAYEEESLFPAIRKLATGDPEKNVALLLEEMRTDHDQLGAQLHQLRKLTDGFAVPEDACVKYKEMLTGLESLERDLHIHVHLENNVLLPRALKLAESTKTP